MICIAINSIEIIVTQIGLSDQQLKSRGKTMKFENGRLLKSLVVFQVILALSGCASQDSARIADAKAASSAVQVKDDSNRNLVKSSSTVTPKSDTLISSSAVTGESSATRDQSDMKESVGLSKALEQIYFDFDSSALSDDARKSLAKNADILKKNASVDLLIEGNCDERGSDQYNIALGEKRAKAAMKYLVAMGIPERKLSVISYGEEKPAVTGHDENAWHQNRRDEFKVLAK
jgi:peptidoglycan-associated lipoprotein